jgi:aquaporin Z
MPLSRRLAAEFIGTFWLVFGGTGSAVLAAVFFVGPDKHIPVGIGFAGVALAFGLTLLTMAYAIGHISGCHINPAVTLGLWAAKRFPAGEIIPYWIAQVVGAIVASLLLLWIASGSPDFAVATNGLAANGYDAHSPGGYTMLSGLVIEIVLTAGFLFVINGAVDGRAPRGFAPIAIGLVLTLIHLVSIPVTNTSVNPARSTGPALVMAMFGVTWAVGQLWLFWVAPLIGGLIGGFAYRAVAGPDEPVKPVVAGDLPV